MGRRHADRTEPPAGRQRARRQIVAAANRVSMRRYLGLPPYTMRHLQHCVHIVRQHRCVTPLTLSRAGFQERAR